MRVMLDTNILFSAFFFPNGTTGKTLGYLTSYHQIVLCSYVIEEIKRVILKKVPNKSHDFDVFLTQLDYEYAHTPNQMDTTLYEIRDPKDYPILYSAILYNVDVLLTGDEDFRATSITHPEILTPREFLDKYKSFI